MADTEKIKSDDKDEKYRVYASLSFAFFLLVVGLPLWWYTTAVPRVPLPYSGIAALADLDLRISTKIIVATPNTHGGKQIVEKIQTHFENAEIYRLHVSHVMISSHLLLPAYTLHDLDKISSTFELNTGDLLLLEAPNLSEGVIIGSKRVVYFSPKTGAKYLIRILSEWILRDKSLALTKNALTEPTNYSLDEENRRRVPVGPNYDALLTVVNPDPERLKINWSLSSVADEYFQPFLDELSIITTFTVKSQWLYLLPLAVTPKQVPDSSPLGRHFALPEDVLPQLITPLEKKLASQVSLNPSINLVVYMVPCASAPLHIYTRNGRRSNTDLNIEAFHSPRWGGILISNPPSEICENAKPDEQVEIFPEEASIIGVFLAQLRLLLGIPEPHEIPYAYISPLVDLKPREWELDALLRVRVVEQLTSAKLTLQSLAQLLEEISNIVITDTVGNRIRHALEMVEQSARYLETGDLKNGFLSSKDAFTTAEAAFTDPSLLALLYFPDDQKYAVYIPLFLPVMIPVLLSLWNIVRRSLKKNKKSDNKDDVSDGNDPAKTKQD